jgi:hypothetical protein
MLVGFHGINKKHRFVWGWGVEDMGNEEIGR